MLDLLGQKTLILGSKQVFMYMKINAIATIKIDFLELL